MVRLRHLLAWLLLAALPLQGFAAATMLQCGPAQRAAVLQVLAAQAVPDQGHPHAPGAQHDHAGHHGHSGGGHHTAAAAPDGPVDHDPPLVDKGHGCAACAGACHAVGLTGEPVRLALAPAPLVPANDPFLRFDSPPPPLPDKPPRA